MVKYTRKSTLFNTFQKGAKMNDTSTHATTTRRAATYARFANKGSCQAIEEQVVLLESSSERLGMEVVARYAEHGSGMQVDELNHSGIRVFDCSRDLLLTDPYRPLTIGENDEEER
jgi:hypothetical protein